MQAHDESIKTFFEGLDYYLSVSQVARRSLARVVAPSFSVFDYIQPNENMLSTIIAELLNPHGDHGQGDIFLRKFLAILGPVKGRPGDWETADLSDAVVVKEARTAYLENDKRRIDICIELSDSNDIKYGIGMENKPWAIEQEAQLSDYNKHLSRQYDERYVIVFLCPTGRHAESIAPQTWIALKKADRAVVMTYTSGLLRWLEDCHRWCQADKVRHFLKDFMAYIQLHLSGNEPGEEE